MTKATPHARSDLTAASSSGMTSPRGRPKEPSDVTSTAQPQFCESSADAYSAIQTPLSASSARTDSPSANAAPANEPAKARAKVVFPHPLGPTTAISLFPLRRMPSNNSFDIKKQPPYTNVPGIRKPFVSPRIRLLQFSI